MFWAWQVVFSRAVIALGSDFGVESLPQELVGLWCHLGTFHWCLLAKHSSSDNTTSA